MAQIDEIIAEVDTYTDYCRMLDYQIAKSEEYATKASEHALALLGLVTAQFPYGVGPTIMAGKAAALQAVAQASDVAEGVAAAASIASKLSELEIPEEGCS